MCVLCGEIAKEKMTKREIARALHEIKQFENLDHITDKLKDMYGDEFMEIVFEWCEENDVRNDKSSNKYRDL